MSKRYCVVCDKVTTWIINKNINHSECLECGARFGRNPSKYYEQIIKIKNLEIMKLQRVVRNIKIKLNH